MIRLNTSYSNILRKLKALPPDRRETLVVRSLPFGDIIEADTRKVHVEAVDLLRIGYDLCQEAKRGA